MFAHPPRSVLTATHHLDGKVSVVAGSRRFTSVSRIREPLAPGLKLVVILSGATTITLGRRVPRRFEAPAALVLLTGAAVEREQVFSIDVPYRFALVDLSPDVVSRELGFDVTALIRTEEDGCGLVGRPATKPEQAIAAQLLASGQSTAQGLFRLAKSLELAAIVLGTLSPPMAAGSARRLTTDDVSRIHAAREALLADLARPPDLPSLALSVGINGRKLGQGFRAVFGSTPYAFVQEERLQEAHRRLVAGGASVSEVAYGVGYSPAHFATLFSRRFGLSPSKLAGFPSR